MELSDIFQTLLYPKEDLEAKGHFQSRHGTSFIAKCYLPFIGIPESEEKTDFTLAIQHVGKQYQWIRRFKKKPFSTYVTSKGDGISERSGLARFLFKIVAPSPQTLEYHFQELRLLGIRIPSFLSIRASAVCKRISASEWRFEVTTTTPSGKLVVKYWGQARLKRD